MTAAQNQVAQLIVQEAQQVGLDAQIALQVAQQESGFNQSARGAAGEIGVFQLMPATARDLGVDPFNLLDNIRGGVRYLKQLLAQFNGNLAQALAAYNAGPRRVGQAVESGESWFSQIPATTQRYVSSVLAALGFGTAAPASSAPSAVPSALPTPGGYVYVAETLPAPAGMNWAPWAVLGAALLGAYVVLES